MSKYHSDILFVNNFSKKIGRDFLSIFPFLFITRCACQRAISIPYIDSGSRGENSETLGENRLVSAGKT